MNAKPVRWVHAGMDLIAVDSLGSVCGVLKPIYDEILNPNQGIRKNGAQKLRTHREPTIERGE